MEVMEIHVKRSLPVEDAKSRAGRDGCLAVLAQAGPNWFNYYNTNYFLSRCSQLGSSCRLGLNLTAQFAHIIQLLGVIVWYLYQSYIRSIVTQELITSRRTLYEASASLNRRQQLSPCSCQKNAQFSITFTARVLVMSELLGLSLWQWADYRTSMDSDMIYFFSPRR